MPSYECTAMHSSQGCVYTEQCSKAVGTSLVPSQGGQTGLDRWMVDNGKKKSFIIL